MSGKHFWKKPLAALVPEITNWAFKHNVPLEAAFRVAMFNRQQVGAHNQYGYLCGINITESLKPLENYALTGDVEDKSIYLRLTTSMVRCSLDEEKHQTLLSLYSARRDARKVMDEVPAVPQGAWSELFFAVTQHWPDDIGEHVQRLDKLVEILAPRRIGEEGPVEALTSLLAELDTRRTMMKQPAAPLVKKGRKRA
jgi:hypothetical protein